MKRRDHHALGEYIWQLSPVKDNPLLRRAFLIGCVEPDVNVLTYMRGFFRCASFHGHHKENAERHICRQLEKIEYTYIMGVWNCFALGAILHYLADSFTFPHNAAFGKDLHEHRRYEWGLHYRLEKYMRTVNISGNIPYELDNCHDFWLRSHRRYLDEHNAGEDYLTDCKYIVEVCAGIFKYAFVTAAANSQRERIIKIYENTDNHGLVFTRY